MAGLSLWHSHYILYITWLLFITNSLLNFMEPLKGHGNDFLMSNICISHTFALPRNTFNLSSNTLEVAQNNLRGNRKVFRENAKYREGTQKQRSKQSTP